ncbi:MAG: polyprenyl synthetase family protein [Marinilabiliales bacterium]|nr:polyprenyl synthetase family protein [Marinilabiliales bacterium]
MASKNEITAPVEDELRSFEPYFQKSTRTSIPLLDTVMHYILRRKGKQMRPILVFLAAKMNGTFNERSYHAALTIELLHTATLVHDDVVDESYQRRGFFSVNAIWKNKIAVLVGDFILAKGLLWSIEHKDYDILQFISAAVRDMSEGEILQIQKARKLDITEEVYFEIIRKKTASLMATSAAVGTCSVTDDAEAIERMRLFGEYAGIAFQIKDDLFDFQKTNLLGKPSGNDLHEKKITLPLIYALQEGSDAEKRRILGIVRKKGKSAADIREVTEFIADKGGFAYAEKVMESYHQKALSLLEAYPDSEYKRGLIAFTHYITTRDK